MPRDGGETRGRIERAALGLFARKGIDQATIADIAREAGISEGAIYRHYPSKDALIWLTFSTHYQALAQRMDLLQAGESGLRGKLRVMIEAFCALFEADRDLFAFLLLVQHGQIPRIPAEMPTPVKVIARVMAEARAAGEIDDLDPYLATSLVMGAVVQPATFKIYGRIEAPMTELAETLSEAAWRAVEPAAASAGGGS